MFTLVLFFTAIAPWLALPPEAPSAPIPGYSLAWSDEFDGGPGRPDPTRWKAWALGPRRDAINVEDAALLDGNGHLVITTRRVERDGRPVYETGGVWTHGLFEQQHGYFEARIKFQSRRGHWGAFWLNCDGVGSIPGDKTQAPTGGGPGGVEMDIIEFHHLMKNGFGQKTAQQTLHWDGYGKDHKSRGHTPGIAFNPADDFHTYAMLWTAEEYVFFIDGIETWRVKKSEPGTEDKTKPGLAPSTRPEYLILSLEVGDWAGKAAERDAQAWPDSMAVDWVRVWQKASGTGGKPNGEPSR